MSPPRRAGSVRAGRRRGVPGPHAPVAGDAADDLGLGSAATGFEQERSEEDERQEGTRAGPVGREVEHDH